MLHQRSDCGRYQRHARSSDVYSNTDVTPGVLDSSFGEISVDVRVSTYADWIDAAVVGSNPEFRVNTTIANDQKWSSVAMDADGDFVITWTSYNQDGTGNGYGAGVNGENGVYAQRYNADGSTVGNEFQVNTYTDDNQQHSSVAMDADGDFIDRLGELPGAARGQSGRRRRQQLRHLRAALRPQRSARHRSAIGRQRRVP